MLEDMFLNHQDNMCIGEMKIHFLSLLTPHVTQMESEVVVELVVGLVVELVVELGDTQVVELDGYKLEYVTDSFTSYKM